MSGYRHMCGSTTSLTLKYKTRILNDNDDDDSSDDENEGDDIDENAFPDAGVFEGTLGNMEGMGNQAIIDCWQLRLADEDDDDYRSRMDSPPDDVIAAVTRLDKRLGTRSGS